MIPPTGPFGVSGPSSSCNPVPLHRRFTSPLLVISTIAILGALGCGPKLEGPRKLIELEQYGAAADVLQRLIQDYPDSAKCYFLLGLARASEASAPGHTAEDQQRLAEVASRAFDTTVKLEPDNDLARLYSLKLQSLIPTGDSQGRLAQLPERTKNAYPALIVGLLPNSADKERIALDALVIKTLARGNNWKAVLKHTASAPQYAVVLSQKATVDCPKKAACGEVERGKVLSISRRANGRAFFQQRLVETKQGWMWKPILSTRQHWYDQPWWNLTPYLFDKQPPECPPASWESPVYFQWMLDHVPHRTLDRSQSATVAETGKHVKAARFGTNGKCKAGQYDETWEEWDLVTYQEQSSEERSLSESALAPGCASSAHEEGRARVLRHEWPDDLQAHLLRGELTRGLQYRMAMASVGVTDACKKFFYGPSGVRASCPVKDVPGLDLDFENDVLVGWTQK